MVDLSRGQNLVPHLLTDPLASNQDAAFLAFNATWFKGSREEAFRFPSFLLAQRYAATLITRGGALWMPTPDPGAAVAAPFVSDNACHSCGCTELLACPGSCQWHAPKLCTECLKSPPLTAWSVFERPREFPEGFLARRFVGVVPTEEVVRGDSLAAVRSQIPRGLAMLPRDAADDPKLREVWI